MHDPGDGQWPMANGQWPMANGQWPMANEFRRLLDTQAVSDSKTPDRELVFDAGAFSQLNVQVFLLAPGASSGTFKLTLQHASVNEENAFIDVKDADGNLVEVDLEGTVGNSFFHITRFLRYVRWRVKATATPSTAAVVGVDIVAKQ